MYQTVDQEWGNWHSFGHLQLVRGHEDDPLLVQNVVDVLQLLADRLTLLLILVSAETAEQFVYRSKFLSSS
jgi:hypothetical protein